MKKIDLFFLLFSLFPAMLFAGPSSNQKVLDEVWQEVARNHFHKDFDARYRKTVYEKHLPAILQSADIPSLTDNLNRMLEDIGHSHLRVFPPGNNGAKPQFRPVENPGPADPPADPGFTVLTCGKELRVREVRPGSAAADAGLVHGDILLEVDGWRCKMDPASAIPAGMTAGLLLERGGTGSICEVKIQKYDTGKEMTLRLKRSAHGGQRVQSPALPPMFLRYEAKMLTARTGYLRFNIFVPEVVKKFRRDRRRGVFKAAENIIIDLRGNPGGILLTAEWLGAWCFPVKLPLGMLIVDGVKLAPVSEPQKGCFNGKVVVLVDGDSASTSEFFAAAVQDGKAGVVIGSKTPGKCLPSIFFNLPSGFQLQAVSGDARRPSGKEIEKIGVTPDIPVENLFIHGKDGVLARALLFLKENK